jgi:hypothetical protein
MVLHRPIETTRLIASWYSQQARPQDDGQGAQRGGFSLEGFAAGEGPRPAGIAVGDVSAQIDAIVLGEIEAGAKAASRQEIFRGERFP